jgi:hypothetical protein
MSMCARLISGFRHADVECGYRLMRVQEIAIITARRGWRIANDYVPPVNLCRTGTRVRDSFTNVFLGVIAAVRVDARADLEKVRLTLTAPASPRSCPAGKLPR